MPRLSISLFRLGASVLAISFVMGCAAPKPPTPQEEIAAWLSASPRTIAVSVDPKLPEATLVSRDHRTGAQVGYAVLGAAEGGIVTIGAGCKVGGPLGCLAGAFLAPIGMVVGAVVRSSKVQSIEHSHPLAAAQGAPEMLTVNHVIDLPAMLAAAVSERRVRPHTLRATKYGNETQSLATAEGTLRLQLYGFDFLGDVGDDPQVALMLKVGAELQTSSVTAAWSGYSYEGSRRRVSSWLADDARRLKEEVNLAARSLATDIGQDLNSPRSLNTRPFHSPNASQSRRWGDELRLLGTIAAGNDLPPGQLHLVPHTLSSNGAAWLVINFEAATEQGEWSYAAYTITNCATKALVVRFSTTWPMKDGEGTRIAYQEHDSPLEVRPGAALTSAIEAICEAKQSKAQ